MLERTVMRGTVVLLVALATSLTLVGCGDPDGSDAAARTPTTDGNADEVVAEAMQAVLGEGSFRSRITGQVPFVAETTGIFEQSGDDVLEITDMGSLGSASAVVGDTAYEWDSATHSWSETPLESFDPLIYPGFSYWLALIGLFDVPDDLEAVEQEPDAALEVATGWAEVAGGPDRVQQLERTLSPELLTGSERPYEDEPIERHEEDAVVMEFYELATVSSIVELDADGKVARYIIRVVFDGSPDHPDCAPLMKFTGITEQVVEFRDVGTDLTITVPEPDELIASHPILGEPPDFSEEGLDYMDSAFTNEAGARDFTGCPTP